MKAKKLIVDIRHPAHLNFFRPAILQLQSEGWKVELIAIDRGRVVKITQKEFPGFKIYTIGKHRGTKMSIIWEANIFRFIKMFFFLLTHRYNIGVSVSSFIMGAAAKIVGMPNLQFYDDPEYKKHVILQRLTSTRTYYPRFRNFDKSIETFNALKEWAYLSPTYFQPNEAVLKEYNLEKGNYIFVREVINTSLNYEEQSANIILTFANQFPKGYKVVLSLEDKSMKAAYPSDWILLNEPVSDIHSLIYYSKIAIASGDSMAREAAMLGVPSIYCGIREMSANRKLVDRSRLFHVLPEACPEVMEKLIRNEYNLISQEEFIKILCHDWEDVTAFIIQRIKQFAKK
jgi:uncharacterized protein